MGTDGGKDDARERMMRVRDGQYRIDRDDGIDEMDRCCRKVGKEMRCAALYKLELRRR